MTNLIESYSVLESGARKSEQNGDWVSALNYWNEVRTHYPDRAHGHVGAAVALQILRRFDEAESVLAPLQTEFTNSPFIAIEYARIAHRQSDWTKALSRWREVVARFPDHNIAISGLGTALQCLGRFDEADEILSDAVSRLQGAADVAVEYARVAHRRGDWTEALRRWTLVMSRFPDDAAGVEGACVALERLKRFDEWEQLLGSAVARFANRATFAADYARAATRRSDWLEARRRWEAAQSRFPNDRAIREGFGATELRLRLDIIDSDGAREPDDVVEKTPTGLGCSPRELMMRFESLGSGCAFGLVQRHFGAEPLGLLRWGAIPPAALARALDQGFEGIGNPDNVRVFEFYNSKEYFFRDVFYSLEMHTFVSMNDVPIERMTKQMIRRVTYLADKLKMDLALPRDEAKMYVYKNHTGSMSMNEVNLIFRSLRRYGKHTLLCIRSADDEHAEGVVEVVEDGLLIGRLDGLEASNSNAANGVRYEAWFDVCARAHEIWSKAIADDPA